MDTTLDGHARSIWLTNLGDLGGAGCIWGFHGLAKSTIELAVWAKIKVVVTEISGDLSLLA